MNFKAEGYKNTSHANINTAFLLNPSRFVTSHSLFWPLSTHVDRAVSTN